MRRALITGVTGQDGSYLTELLLEREYEVHGVIRRSSSINTSRIDHIYGNKNLHLHYGDVTDALSMTSVIQKVEPQEIYNLAAQSHVKVSFETPEYTAMTDALGTLRILEAVKLLGLDKFTRIYQASTSELYGLVQETPQRETTPFYPRSPYGVAKLYAYWITKNYREAYDMFACSGILFNHESPRRGHNFVTQKIVQGMWEWKKGKIPFFTLGNLDAKRDWGHAKDYVDAMYLILQQEEPDDFVIATGMQYSVRTFVEEVGKRMGINIVWYGSGLKEWGCDDASGKAVVRVDPKYFRPTEVDSLLGDPTKAKTKLGWEPKYDFYALVDDMVESVQNG